MIYLQLFYSFLKIGLFSFGGGYAAMPLIQEQVVNSHGWLSMPEFTDLITISQMTPGPIAINSATFVGIKIAGVPGALVAVLCDCYADCKTLSEISEHGYTAGRAEFSSPRCCGDDRFRRSFHFDYCILGERGNDFIYGNKVGAGHNLYSGCSAFKKI